MNTDSEKDKDLGTLLEDIKTEVSTYVNKRLHLFKLEAYEKAGVATSSIGYGLILLVIFAFFIFFALFGLAFLIGELLDSYAAGFGIMAGVSLLVLLVIIALNKNVKNMILEKTISFINKVESNEGH